LKKDAPQDPNSSGASEAEEQRLKELEEQVLRNQIELEECHARAREKSLKERIEEAEATLRELNEQLQSASHEVIHLDEPNSATKTSQEKNSQKSFISTGTSSPLSINLQLTQWPLGYKFNMIPTFDDQSDPRQFLMSFEATIISGGGDETTLAKSLVMAVKGPA
jgi:seryl-tRNA synthetase